MRTVKISTAFPWWPLQRQTPGGDGVWGSCKFVINTDMPDCDYWVVLEGLQKREQVRCDPRNTMLVTCEPPDFKSYPAEFLRQFNTVLTCHQDIPHPHPVLSQQGLPWMIGARLDPGRLKWSDFLTFSQLEKSPPRKDKLLSIVASKKSFVPGHGKRHEFLERLKLRLGERVDIFGLGYLPIEDKWDAIAPYKYHLVVENSSVPDYWTEKLADAFLGEALPIYYGCPNIREYFSARSLVAIDINDADAAIDLIESVLAEDVHADRVEEIRKAKHDVMYKYNILAVCESMISDQLDSDRDRTKGAGLIRISPEVSKSASLRNRVGRRISLLAGKLRSLGGGQTGV